MKKLDYVAVGMLLSPLLVIALNKQQEQRQSTITKIELPIIELPEIQKGMPWPLEGVTEKDITSRFGYRSNTLTRNEGGRDNYKTKTKKEFHSGIDIGVIVGTPVYSITDGTVTYTCSKGNRCGGYGSSIEIKSGNRKILYAHLSRINVEVGDEVDISTKLGETGSTGRSTGPHLHFSVSELNKKGRYVQKNPLEYLRPTRRRN